MMGRVRDKRPSHAPAYEARSLEDRGPHGRADRLMECREGQMFIGPVPYA